MKKRIKEESTRKSVDITAAMKIKLAIQRLCLKCRYLVCKPKQIAKEDLSVDTSGAQAQSILNYTNNVLKFTLGDSTFFFKEARERKNFKDYISDSIREFFTYICKNADIEKEVSRSLSKKRNLNRLINSGHKNQSGSPFNNYLTTGDERFLGLPLFQGEDKNVARKFIFFIYGEITNYLYNSGIKRGDRQTFLAMRSLAVKRLADKLSIGYLIPDTSCAKVTFNGREKYGVIESEAHGINASGVECGERQKYVTPQLLRDLTSLNVLDVLSFDKDHRINNYHTIVDENGMYIGITSYDNDGPDVFFPSGKVKFANSVKCSALVDKRGLINRPHMDSQLATAVLNLKRESVKEFSEYLNILQRFCLWQRIKKLQRAICKTIKNKSGFLLDREEWSVEHVKEDLSGKYGKTYLVSFLTDCYYPGGASPFDVC